MSSYYDLEVYKKAFYLAMKIFKISKEFPREETYSLIDQIRRSSRSVCQCIAESYRKRRYPKYFVSKLTDADAETSETKVWLDFAFECQYLTRDKYDFCCKKNAEVGKLLGFMIHNPELFS